MNDKTLSVDVVFDLGNVVVNWDPEGIAESVADSEEEKSQLLSAFIGTGYWLELDKGMTTEQEILPRIVAETGIPAEKVLACFEMAKTSLSNIPQTLALISELEANGVRMHCLSNMSVETYDYLKERAFFKNFDCTIISGQVKMVKPESKIFDLLIENTGKLPAQLLFIDDMEPNISAATAKGIQTVHFKRTAACYQKIRRLTGLA
ncbi:HAD family phosphatase [Parasalinivibrio latis]|uniref:HAD family hydrolase n=1 Tax=Parasalinivibrio latis TaxID=2952610 RepID=UPI0030E206C8